MTDSFALLGLARRPWLDSEVLKERFHRLTAEHHPDLNAGTGADFPGIIAAYNLLRDPKARLRHLLELEFPGRAAEGQAVPADLLDLFMQIANSLGAFGRIVKKLEAAQAPLALALLAGERQAALGQLKAIFEILRQQENALLDQLKALDAQWTGNKDATCQDLAQILERLSFLFKWSDQIREAILRLEM